MCPTEQPAPSLANLNTLIEQFSKSKCLITTNNNVDAEVNQNIFVPIFVRRFDGGIVSQLYDKIPYDTK